MLVLSRRPGQKVVFPSLGVSVEVLRSRGSIARLGIVAPDTVPILRDEVLPAEGSAPPQNSDATTNLQTRQQRHEWRNKLNTVLLKMQILQRQLELGQSTDPEHSLRDMFAELRELEHSTDDAVAPPNRPRVLLVEDQANERELLATCLRLGGVEVMTASNGREAFDLLHEHVLPDLVLLDMRMPEMDGPTLLRAIRDDLRMHDLRVFAVSGSEIAEFDAQPLPIDGWFSKPVRVDALLQAVQHDRQTGVSNQPAAV